MIANRAEIGADQNVRRQNEGDIAGCCASGSHHLNEGKHHKKLKHGPDDLLNEEHIGAAVPGDPAKVAPTYCQTEESVILTVRCTKCADSGIIHNRVSHRRADRAVRCRRLDIHGAHVIRRDDRSRNRIEDNDCREHQADQGKPISDEGGQPDNAQEDGEEIIPQNGRHRIERPFSTCELANGCARKCRGMPVRRKPLNLTEAIAQQVIHGFGQKLMQQMKPNPTKQMKGNCRARQHKESLIGRSKGCCLIQRGDHAVDKQARTDRNGEVDQYLNHDDAENRAQQRLLLPPIICAQSDHFAPIDRAFSLSAILHVGCDACSVCHHAASTDMSATSAA